jgi:hypothetical protein
MVFEGMLKSAVFIEFVKRVLRQATRKIYLIVDGHLVHRSVAVRQFAVQDAERLRSIRLPGYWSELNRDELLNQEVKANVLGKRLATSKADTSKSVRRHLYHLQVQTHISRNLIQEKHVRYSAWSNIRTTYCSGQ